MGAICGMRWENCFRKVRKDDVPSNKRSVVSRTSILGYTQITKFIYLFICTYMQMKDLEKKSRVFKALGEPIRLKIIEYLMKKGKCTCICDLSKILKRDQSVIFRHIQILKDCGILNTDKEAQFLMCCIKDKDKIMKFLKD